jgi:PAS domain-containing protein
MRTTIPEFRHRIGAALERASLLDDRLSATISPADLTKTIAEVRKLVRQLQVSFEDLTDAMTEHARAKAFAETIQHRAATIFRLVPTPCIVTDATGVVVDMNPAAADLLNTAPRFVAGRNFHLFLGGDRPRFIRLLQEVQHSGDTGHLAVTIRPRERAPLNATLTIAQEAADEVLIVLQLNADAQVSTRRGRPHMKRPDEQPTVQPQPYLREVL